MATRNYPEYAAIEQHIRRANIERVVGIAEVFADFILDSWSAIKKVPAFLASDRRRAWSNTAKATSIAARSF